MSNSPAQNIKHDSK